MYYDNKSDVSEGLAAVAIIDDALLDELVPQPWPKAKRVAAGALVAFVVVAIAVAWWAGLLGPRLQHAGGWGAGVDGDPTHQLRAFHEIDLRNAGRVPLEVQAFVPPQLDGVDWLPTQPALPVTLAPGQTRSVRVAFVADGCDVEGGGLEGYRFAARSGPLPARNVEIAMPGLGPRHSSAGQEPSWVLDAISMVCDGQTPR